jgi:hypothetical protein
MIAINLIIDTPKQINMMRGWETAADKQNRALWLDHLYNVLALANHLPPANDTIDQRALRHIAGLDQAGKFYEYNTLTDYLEA